MAVIRSPIRAPLRTPMKPPGTAALGLGRTSRRDTWWLAPGVQAVVFTVCATYLFVSGILLTPLFQTPYEYDGYLSPLFSPLIAPAWLPSWISPGPGSASSTGPAALHQRPHRPDRAARRVAADRPGPDEFGGLAGGDRVTRRGTGRARAAA